MPLPIPAPRDAGSTTTTAVPLYWCAYGPPGAPRLLVLHGGPGAHHDYMLPQMLRLADRHELLFYDQRGGGRSKTEDRAPITWRTHVDDLAALIEELDVDPLTIVGYSWGGLLALLHAVEASRSPEIRSPARLVLLDPAPLSRAYREQFEEEFARRQRSAEVQEMRTELAASGLRESDPEAYRQRLFEIGVAGYFADPAAARDLTPFRVTGRIQQSVWESLGDFDLAPRLAAVRAPTLVIHGRQDPIPLDSSAVAARALGGRLVVIDACGHVPYVEQPESVFEAIERFLADTASVLPGRANVRNR